MKAIKLASIFAVSAVAAAVSTTTFAAEPVFKGTAGLNYYSYEDNAVDSDGDHLTDGAGSEGEVNIIGDTGVVYFDLDMSEGSFLLDEAYVTQGAVQFGDFDGSLLDSVAFSAGVWEDNDDAKYINDNDLAVRYSVSEDLTVAVEATEDSNKADLAFAYTTEMSGLSLGVSGIFHDSDNAAVTLGLSAPLGIATLSTFVVVGSDEEADVMNTGLGLDLPVSEQLSFAAQYYTKGGEVTASDVEDDSTLVEGDDFADQGVFEVAAYYTAGDITYFASYVSKETDDANYSVVGAYASF